MKICVMGMVNCVWFGKWDFSSINTALSLHDIRKRFRIKPLDVPSGYVSYLVVIYSELNFIILEIINKKPKLN